jgi:oligopeptide/dipeptide ABC transporter ATP-binding protein
MSEESKPEAEPPPEPEAEPPPEPEAEPPPEPEAEPPPEPEAEPPPKPEAEPPPEPEPKAESTPPPAAAQGLLEIKHLQVLFPIKSGVLINRAVGYVHAVDDVSFVLHEGETLGIVGESGCGKTTLIRALVRLIASTGGSISFRGNDITKAKSKQLAPIRREMQMVFQDPQASLNPRKRVGQIIATPLRKRGLAKSEIEPEGRRLLERVGLSPEHLNRFPHEFSGGQRQRIGIARALAMEPQLILLDEPVSALDVSIQAQVINLLDDLQDDLHLSYIFVAHDLSVVRHVSDRIIVMYLGKLMEVSPAEELYSKPIHPYTSALLGAIPLPDPRQNRSRTRQLVTGEPPNPINPPSGCRFHSRCPRATEVCEAVEPQLTEYAGGHLAACHHPQHVSAAEIASARRSETSPVSAGDQPPAAEGQAAPASSPD